MTTISMREAEQMIRLSLTQDEPFLLIGEPGMGKTSLFEAVAKSEDIGFIDSRLSQKDPVDVGGMRVPDMKTGVMRHFAPEDLPVEGAKGFPERGILLYDEINVVGMLLQATAYGIIQERRVGMKRLMPGWVPMGSGNNVADRAAAQRISTALANRFNVQYVKPDVQSWLVQYGSEHVDTRGTAYLRFRPEMFHQLPKDPNEVRFPSARSWTKAFKFIDQEPVFRRKIFAGYVGPTAADDFESFWRILERAVPFDKIVADPKNAPVPGPTDPGTTYAVIGMLGRLVDRKTFEPAMIYTGRMTPDYQAAFIADATKREPGLKNTAAYGQWAVAHQGYTL